ncbi:P-selectin-like [Branchiostoma floridae]|uniref:P-selectin-like n=1 Tax=Branchiostoma floridae TaxID=7739 RepID=A0A9J7MNX9_BRAFL|nr:P-selectin-like [Branchiostoma floridae]
MSGCFSPYTHGESCSYYCSHGYSQVYGSTTRTCRYGIWTGTNLVCRRDCPAPPTLSYTSRSGCSSPYTHGETCTYSCRSGYTPVSGSTTKTCSDGSWTGTNLVCKRDCPAPPTLSYTSRIGCSSPYTHGETCTYSCRSGYARVSGNTTRTCLYSHWAGTNLVCRRVCSSPPTPTNTSMSGCFSPYTHGESCSFYCSHGYTQVYGSTTRTCSNGHWTGTNLVCRRDCPASPTLGNTYRSGCYSPYTHGERCFYSCRYGYIRVSGSTTWTCFNGHWVGTNLVCRRTERSEFVELHQEVQQLARGLPGTLAELGLTSVVQHVQELKTNEYLGCYRDGSPHSFPRKVMTSSAMTTERCTTACRNAGYAYAATEASRSRWRRLQDCHCGREADFNRLGQRVCDSECNSRCRGNRNQKCGGRYRMSVYKIDSVPGCEGGPRQVGIHWYVTGTTTNLQYQGSPQNRPFAFCTQVLDRETAIPIQGTLVNMTADIQAFPSQYPATSAEGMPDLVPDYAALLASLQAPGQRLMIGTDTVLELDQHFSIKSHSCSLEYNPGINGQSGRPITMRINFVREKPHEVIVEIMLGH